MNKNNKLLKGGGDKFGPVSVPYGSSRELDKALTEGPTELAKKSTLLATQSTNNLNNALIKGSSNLNKAFTEGSSNLNNASTLVTSNLNNAFTEGSSNLNNASTLVTNNLNNTLIKGSSNLNNTLIKGSSNLNKAFTEGSEELTKTSASVINASGPGPGPDTIDPGTGTDTIDPGPVTTTIGPGPGPGPDPGPGPGPDPDAPNTDAKPYNFNDQVAEAEAEAKKNVAAATQIQKASEAKQSSNPAGFMTVWLAPFVFWSKNYLSIAKAFNAEVGPIVHEAADLAASTTAELSSIKEIASFNADSRVKDQAFVTHLEVYYTENPGIERLDPESLEWKKAKQKYEDELKEFTEKDDTKEGDTKEGDTKEGDTKKGEKEVKKGEEEEKKGEEVKKGWFGGNSRKTLTLGQIQKGGRQSANRTKKSIHDFFKSSVTSSHILKMVKKHGDNKRNTKVKRKRVGKRSRKGRQ